MFVVDLIIEAEFALSSPLFFHVNGIVSEVTYQLIDGIRLVDFKIFEKLLFFLI